MSTDKEIESLDKANELVALESDEGFSDWPEEEWYVIYLYDIALLLLP